MSIDQDDEIKPKPIEKPILFMDDWKKYPNAIVDDQTKNESFLYLADVLKVMGIQNNLFHLSLKNPKLQGVNPRNKGLDAITSAMIRTECEQNFWYFIREILLIPEDGSPSGVRFRANRGNIAAYWSFLNHVDYLLVMMRQGGKSVCDDGMDLYIMYIAGRGVTINKLTKDASLRERNVKRLKQFRDLLPPYLNMHNPRTDKNNNEELTCMYYSNTLNMFVGQAAEIAADKVARGHTAAVNRTDEGPFTNNAHVSIQVMLTTGTRARDSAKDAGSFYCTSHVTTAGKINTKPGRYMYKIKEDSMYFSEHLYDSIDQKHLHKLVTAHSAGGIPMLNITMSHYQLGYDDKWLKRKILENRMDVETADRDMLNRWTNGGTTHPLDGELLGEIERSASEIRYIEYTEHGFIINWYVSKEERDSLIATRKVIIGNDSSTASGGDAMSLVFTDTLSGNVLAGSKVSVANIFTYAEMLANQMLKNVNYITNIERRSMGPVLIDAVMLSLMNAGINPLLRMYNTMVDSDGWRNGDFAEFKRSPAYWSSKEIDQVKKSIGFATSASGKHSRNSLYNMTLPRAASLGCHGVRDQRLINEILMLEKTNDRIDHPSDGNDDMVIGWLLAYWMLIHSRNLDAYGIDAPLRDTKEWVKGKLAIADTPRQALVEVHRKTMYLEVEKLVERLSNTRCPYASAALERMIRRSHERIGNEGLSLSTLDDMIKRALSDHEG